MRAAELVRTQHVKPPVSHNPQSQSPDQHETPQDLTFMENQTSGALSKADKSGFVAAVQNLENEERVKGDGSCDLQHNSSLNIHNSDKGENVIVDQSMPCTTTSEGP